MYRREAFIYKPGILRAYCIFIYKFWGKGIEYKQKKSNSNNIKSNDIESLNNNKKSIKINDK